RAARCRLDAVAVVGREHEVVLRVAGQAAGPVAAAGPVGRGADAGRVDVVPERDGRVVGPDAGGAAERRLLELDVGVEVDDVLALVLVVVAVGPLHRLLAGVVPGRGHAVGVGRRAAGRPRVDVG